MIILSFEYFVETILLMIMERERKRMLKENNESKKELHLSIENISLGLFFMNRFLFLLRKTKQQE